MRKKISKLWITPLAVMAVLLFSYGCSDDSADLPSVTTSAVTDITGLSAVGGGNVTDDGGDPVTDRGVVLGLMPDPSLDENVGRATSGSGEGEFTTNITGLSPETTYFVRAYAINSEGTGYGESIQFTTPEMEPELLVPGNWENATGFTSYYWQDEGEHMGYIFGTNVYGDTGYGQLFRNTQSFSISSVLYWIGAKEGTSGEVVFTIWEFSGGSPGNVLGSETISMADIEASQTLEDALWVEFEEEVVVTGDFIVGADISGLDDFVEDEYYLGHVSTQQNDGGGGELAWIREGNDWLPVMTYDIDVDIAVFPLVQLTEKSGDKMLQLLQELPAGQTLPAHLKDRVRAVESHRP